jgi:anti-sigma factor RsiW
VRDETSQSKHASWTGKLDAYLDGELDATQMKELDGHLRACSECTAEALRRVQWKRAIHSAGLAFTPGAALRERIQKRVSSNRTPWWHWRPAFAATAAVLLLLAGGRLLQEGISIPKSEIFKNQGVQESRVVSELADLHVTTLASANPVDVISTDRHNVKPWFAGKIPFTFDLPELQGTGFELVGGRVGYIEQSPGAQLLYRIRKHQVSVFIFQSKSLPRELAFAEDKTTDAKSFHLESWQRNGLQYFVIGDVAPEDIHALANLLKQ